jgi:hypothetical protein
MTRLRQDRAVFRSARRTGHRPCLFRSPERRNAPPLGLILRVASCQSPRQEESVTHTPKRPLTEVLAARTPELMKVPGVVGTAESQLEDGRPCILVMVVHLTPALRRDLPEWLEGWPVRVEETGEIHALPDSAR